MQESRRCVSIIEGVHREWAHKVLEAAVNGIVEFKLHEGDESQSNVMSIRHMGNVPFDGRRRRLKVSENFEVTLEK